MEVSNVQGDQIVVNLWQVVSAFFSLALAGVSSLVWIFATFERRDDAKSKHDITEKSVKKLEDVHEKNITKLEKDITALKETLGRVDSNVSFLRGVSQGKEIAAHE